jgi:hypothetical protein
MSAQKILKSKKNHQPEKKNNYQLCKNVYVLRHTL